MNDTANQNYQRKSKVGNQNPFYGHHHTDSSKQKISDSQKQRYQQYKKTIDNITLNTPILLPEFFAIAIIPVIMETIANMIAGKSVENNIIANIAQINEIIPIITFYGLQRLQG